MFSALRRQTYGRSPERAWIAAYQSSTKGHVGGSARATGVSSRGEYSKDGWVPTGGVVPLSWRFSAGLVLASAISVISGSLVWVKRIVGRNLALISPSESSCII